MDISKITQRRNQLVLIEHKVGPGEVVPIGATKLGGAPDIPDGFEFPKVKAVQYTEDIEDAQDTYLRFITQYNCEELSNYDTENILPKSGIISVFFDTYNMPDGYDPSHKGGVRVFYFEDINSLHRATLDEMPDIKLIDEEDEGEDEGISCSKLTAEYTFKVRTQESYFSVSDYEDSEQDTDDLWENKVSCDDDELIDAMFRMLGWESSVQMSPKLECSAVSQGICADGDYVDNTPIEEIANGWQLLGHVCLHAFFSDTECVDYASDLYIEIPAKDLENKDFSNVRAVVQYT